MSIIYVVYLFSQLYIIQKSAKAPACPQVLFVGKVFLSCCNVYLIYGIRIASLWPIGIIIHLTTSSAVFSECAYNE